MNERAPNISKAKLIADKYIARDGDKPAADVDDIIDLVVEIERLATLVPIDYEVARAEAVARLKVRASVLDREVARKRRALGLETDKDDDGQGRAVKIVDPLPWHERVSGDWLATTLAVVVKTYLVVSDVVADTIALWIMHTWMVNVFTMSPRLGNAGTDAKMPFKVHPHMLRHATGYALANKGTDTRTLQAYLGHRSIQSTVRYTELAPGRFKNLWR